jgi:hypothetical protein
MRDVLERIVPADKSIWPYEYVRADDLMTARAVLNASSPVASRSETSDPAREPSA